jgi:hypothetical protein
MQDSRSLSRRTALAGLGAGSLGLLFGSHAAGLPTASNRETGGNTGSNLVNHPLTGLWLAHLALSPDNDATAAVPAFFGADGSAMLAYPCSEITLDSIQIRGVALGTWIPIDDHEAHFTAVQVCFGADGAYRGTRTYDAYPVVSGDGNSFTVRGESDLVTVRDASNTIAERRLGSLRLPMYGFRMTPGNPGFPTSPDWPEVAPVHPGDQRLAPTPVPSPGPGPGDHQ